MTDHWSNIVGIGLLKHHCAAADRHVGPQGPGIHYVQERIDLVERADPRPRRPSSPVRRCVFADRADRQGPWQGARFSARPVTSEPGGAGPDDRCSVLSPLEAAMRRLRMVAMVLLMACVATAGYAQTGGMTPDQMKAMSGQMKMMSDHMKAAR